MCSIIVKYFRLLWVKFREKKNNYIKWSTFLLSFNSYCYLNCYRNYNFFYYTLFLPEFKLYSCICPPHERFRSWCRLYTRTIDCIVSIRWLNPECIDRQCLSSEWTDWQLPVIWKFQRQFVWKYHPAAHVRQCPLYKELFNREMHQGMSAWPL